MLIGKGTAKFRKKSPKTFTQECNWHTSRCTLSAKNSLHCCLKPQTKTSCTVSSNMNVQPWRDLFNGPKAWKIMQSEVQVVCGMSEHSHHMEFSLSHCELHGVGQYLAVGWSHQWLYLDNQSWSSYASYEEFNSNDFHWLHHYWDLRPVTEVPWKNIIRSHYQQTHVTWISLRRVQCGVSTACLLVFLVVQSGNTTSHHPR